MRSLILTLAAACMVVSGVAYSLHATLSPSSPSSTIADKATTVGKLDSDAIVEPEPPQEAMPAVVQAPSIEASPTDFHEVAKEASDDRTAVETTSGPPPAVVAARVEHRLIRHR